MSGRIKSSFLCLSMIGMLLGGCDIAGLRGTNGSGSGSNLNTGGLNPYYPGNGNTYRVRFRHPDGLYDVTLNCPDDLYLLDCLENNSIDHSYSSRAGADSTDAVRILSGTVDQSDQSFLDDDQIDSGFALISVAYPTSDLDILTEQEEAL
jgi:ferredoxin